MKARSVRCIDPLDVAGKQASLPGCGFVRFFLPLCNARDGTAV